MYKIFINLAAVMIVSTSAVRGYSQDRLPVAWWSFDADAGETVTDHIGEIDDMVRGNFKYVGGVTGSSLRFDGYTTHIVRAVDLVPLFEGSFTIEAWVAPQTYPWNWTAVVDHEVDRRGGYFFGNQRVGSGRPAHGDKRRLAHVRQRRTHPVIGVDPYSGHV